MATKFNFIDDVNQLKDILCHISTPRLFTKKLLIFYFYVKI